MSQPRFGQKLQVEVTKLLQKATQELQGGAGDSAVHEVRKCLKRVRALARLLEPFAENPVAMLEAGVKEIHLQLAPHREAAVLIQLLRELLEPEAALQVADWLRMSPLPVEETTDFAQFAPRLRQQLADLCDAWEASPKLTEGWREIAPQIQGLYHRGRKQWRAGPEDSSAWHHLRTSAKRLQYVIHFLTPWASERLNGEYRQIDALTEVLGRQHDIAELQSRLAVSGHGQGGQVFRVLRTQLEQQVQELTQQGHELAAVVYAESPKSYLQRLDCYRRARRHS